MNILRKNIKPTDCLLVFGIPITNEWTHMSAIDQSEKDPNRFINQNGRPFSLKEYQLILPEERVDSIEKIGVSVKRCFSKKKINSLFSGKYSVVIFFTHWHDKNIECYDGFISINDFVDQIPENGKSIICDLSICHPKDLAHAIKEKRKDYYIHYSGSKLNTKKWLNLLTIFFRVLHEHNVSYPEAWEKTTLLWTR